MAMSILVAGSASADSTTDRYSGANRYGTAADIAGEVFTEQVDKVFVAVGDTFADALAAGPAAARTDAPVLLTRTDRLPDETVGALERFSPAQVFVVGGPSVVSQQVLTELERFTETVVRVSGSNRYSTGVEISQEFWTASGTVYLATGTSFADALSGGPLAARQGAPILLSKPGGLPQPVAAELQRLDPSEVVLLGGSSALSQRVRAEAADAVPGAMVSRLSGPNRYATSASIARAGWGTAPQAYFATGVDFPDALAGVPAAATVDAPLLLTRKACMPTPVAAEADRLGAEDRVLLGGTAVLTKDAATLECGTEGVRLRQAIEQLPVAAETNNGYDRDLFDHWIDADDDCQDTRDEVLAQESRVAVSGCDITQGEWFSYYDREIWTQSGDVDIDHMVPLAEAWGSGAKAWNADTRERFANDLDDDRALVAVTDNVNQSKGARDPAEWMPDFGQCRYIREWTAIKLRWQLRADQAEKNALRNLAQDCNNDLLQWREADATTSPPPPPPGDGSPNGVKIARVVYDPAGSDDGSNLNQERVVIENSSGRAKILTNWTLSDEAGATYVFPEYRLPAGDTVVVHSGDGGDGGRHLYAGWGYTWNNTGDTAYLRAANRTRADTCSWGNGSGTVTC